MNTTSLTAASAAKAAAPAAVSFGSLAGMVLALLMVLALILGMAWLLRRLSGLGGLQGPDGLRTIASLSVGPKERVLIVQAGDAQLLVGVTAQQVTLLHRLEKPLPAPVAGDSFATLLARRLGKDVTP